MVTASKSLPRESFPKLFHRGFFPLESIPIIDKGVAELSRINEAV
jgi:hypothetical protein